MFTMADMEVLTGWELLCPCKQGEIADVIIRRLDNYRARMCETDLDRLDAVIKTKKRCTGNTEDASDVVKRAFNKVITRKFNAWFLKTIKDEDVCADVPEKYLDDLFRIVTILDELWQTICSEKRRKKIAHTRMCVYVKSVRNKLLAARDGSPQELEQCLAEVEPVTKPIEKEIEEAKKMEEEARQKLERHAQNLLKEDQHTFFSEDNFFSTTRNQYQ